MGKLKKFVCSSLVISFAMLPFTVNAMTKDETVYTTLNKNGELYKTTVVNHLYQTEDETIEDVTELKDILNINGEETFTINGKNLTWKNKGKEIFYQGMIEKELPIQTEVTYYLDGIEKNSKEMIGQKGKVEIVIKLKNTDQHQVLVNGTTETLYTPFVVTAGTILSGKMNSNIEVSNGRVVDTGSKTIAVSLAAPGLYDSLKIDNFKDMDTIRIRYDTTSYKENPIYFVAVPKLMDTTDFKVFDKLDSMFMNVDKLQVNIDTIESGMSSLEDGASQLASGSKELSDNLQSIVSYMSQLENGSLEMDNGLKQVIAALNDVQNQLQTGSNESSLASLTQLKTENTNAISRLTMTNTTINDLFVRYGMDVDTILVDQLPENLATYKQTYDGNRDLIYLLSLNNQALDEMMATTVATSQMIDKVVLQLQESMVKLEKGANILYSSIIQIRGGVEQLYNGSLSLNDGANTLYSGATTLKAGITTYNQEGIQVLSNYANQATIITNRIEALTDLSNNYKGFASDNSHTTTFVSVIK